MWCHKQKRKKKKKEEWEGGGGGLFTDPKQFRKHKKSYQLRGPFKHPMHVKCLNRVFQCLWVERGTILCMSSSYSCYNSNNYKVHPSKLMLWLFIIFWIKPFVKKCLNHMSWKPFAMLFFSVFRSFACVQNNNREQKNEQDYRTASEPACVKGVLSCERNF